MKVFAVILSVFILTLSVLPCDDAFVRDNTTGVSLSSGENSHDFDTCTPFCICNCCQSNIVVSILSELKCFEEVVLTNYAYSCNFNSLDLFDLLIPPKA